MGKKAHYVGQGYNNYDKYKKYKEHEEHDCSDCHDEKDHECMGCICNTLKILQTQTELDIFLSSGQVIEDVVFITFDRKSCCAFFVDSEKPVSTFIVDCQKIDALRFTD